jgi:starch-binding outer membrane protein, SusD/RagB family
MKSNSLMNKSRNMRYYPKYIITFFIFSLVLLSSCKIEPIKDPNNPGLVAISANPTAGEIQNLVSGIESAMRDNMNFYLDDAGVIGREFYRFSTSDPRFTSDLLGKGTAVLDNNTFYITNPFAARYRVIKNANILLDGLTNTTATITAAQRTVGKAYANTIKAHELLMVLNLEWDNGIRVDVSNPDALGPFLTRAQSFDAISTLLNSAYTDLSANPTAFLPFNTSLGGNNSAPEFAKFNRALAARVAIYKSDWAGALTALGNSFFNINGSLNTGVFYNYSSAGGDQLNPMYFPQNSSGETRVAQPAFITNAEAGDARLSKVPIRSSGATTQDGLTSSYDFFVYKTNVDKIPIIRNEELILIYAEAKAQLGGAANFTDAVTAINKIRVSAGLPVYSGAITQPALITEMLKQRRYSLYGEGHRWIDLRRYSLLNTLPIDRAGDDVWVQFPRPANE